MAVGIDACLKQIAGDLYDVDIGVDGDILSVDFFDTAIIVSLFAERRANESEVAESRLRRGWIGNEGTPNFEIGSKIWLYEQARLTRTVINGITIAARQALQTLVDEGFATQIKSVDAIITTTGISLKAVINRPNSKVESRYFVLWDNTALPCPDIPNNIILNLVPEDDGANIFQILGNPSNPVDVLVNMLGFFAPQNDAPALSTGGPWNLNSTITIVVLSIGTIITGGGGHGGDGGGDIVSGNLGGGGGGGITWGKGGKSDDGAHDGGDGNPFLLGSGSVGAATGATSTHPATNGDRGFPAIELLHDITLINNGVLRGGTGGGGGGGADIGTGGNGGPSNGIGEDGTGTDPGLGGIRGEAIKLNGFDAFLAVAGNIIGEIA